MGSVAFQISQNEMLQYYSGYKSAEMKSTVLALQKLRNAKTSKPKHIYQKYQQEEVCVKHCFIY